jgi:hypothetical protein
VLLQEGDQRASSSICFNTDSGTGSGLKSRILRRDLFNEEKSIDMRIVGRRGEEGMGNYGCISSKE